MKEQPKHKISDKELNLQSNSIESKSKDSITIVQANHNTEFSEEKSIPIINTPCSFDINVNVERLIQSSMDHPNISLTTLQNSNSTEKVKSGQDEITVIDNSIPPSSHGDSILNEGGKNILKNEIPNDNSLSLNSPILSNKELQDFNFHIVVASSPQDLECSKNGLEGNKIQKGKEEIKEFIPNINVDSNIDQCRSNENEKLDNDANDLECNSPCIEDGNSDCNEVNDVQVHTRNYVSKADKKNSERYTIRAFIGKLRRFHFLTEHYFRIHSKTYKLTVIQAAKIIGVKIKTLYRYKMKIMEYFKSPFLRRSISIDSFIDKNCYEFERRINKICAATSSSYLLGLSNSLNVEIDLHYMEKYYAFLGLPT